MTIDDLEKKYGKPIKMLLMVVMQIELAVKHIHYVQQGNVDAKLLEILIGLGENLQFAFCESHDIPNPEQVLDDVIVCAREVGVALHTHGTKQ
jgi:uncharacterized protein YpiB (UPF0302 family)